MNFKYSRKMALSGLSVKILIYGIYSVLCHVVAILFDVLSSTSVSSNALALRYAPMLEYSVMSFTLVLIGVLLTEITLRDIRNAKK